MPRKRTGRGGPRQGVTGQSYTNRTDLQFAPDRRPAPIPQPAAPPQQTAAPTALPSMPAVPALNAPTARPNEPITAGLAMGPGPGPEALTTPAGMAPQSSGFDPQLELLRALAMQNDIPELRFLLRLAET